MKDGLSSLTSEMQNLLAGLSRVSEQSIIIRDDLSKNRLAIQRLMGISSLLERVDFISQLPMKLQAHVEIGNYESAVDLWLKAERVLETQTHYESFVRIRDECKRIIDEIKVLVRAKMIDPTTGPSDCIICAATLIKVQLPAPAVLEELMKVRTKVTISSIDELKNGPTVFDDVTLLDKNVVQKSMEFITRYVEILLQYSTPLNIASHREDPMDEYLRNFRRDLLKRLWKFIDLEAVFHLNSEDFTRFLQLLSSRVSIVGLFQQRNGLVQQLVHRYIERSYDRLHEKTVEYISNTDHVVAVDVGFNETVQHFKTEAAQIVSQLEVLVKEQPDAKFVVQQKLPPALTKILETFCMADSQVSLLAFGLSFIFSTRLIPFAFELIARFDPTSPLLNMQGGLQDEASKAARTCLHRFIANRRRMLSEVVCQGMNGTDWIDHRSARTVSISTRLVIEELSYTWSQVDWVVNKVAKGADGSSHGSVPSRTKFSGFSGSAFHSSQGPLFHGLREDNVHQIDRLFTTVNRLHMGAEVEFESKPVLSAIVVYVVKTMLEYVRLNTFSSAGFNQMQIDAYFLYMSVCDKVVDVGLFNAVIEEVLSSAADRTFEPIPLKLVVLQNIYSQYSAKAPAAESD
jgi:hypothetical protein